MSEAEKPWRSTLLDGVPHAFLGRAAEERDGCYGGRSALADPAPDWPHIERNRRRAVDAVLPGAALATLVQVHGPQCHIVREESAADHPLEGDALATDRPGLLLGIVTADCVPVLLADQAAGVIGAAHAGWKGALAGVTDATVAAMVTLGADPARIRAAIGPCITRASYEVDRTLLDAFTREDADNERFFIDGRRSGHWQFDLEAYVAARLGKAGLQHVEAMGLDTYAREGDFCSYRRATHRGEPSAGRQISLIGLAA